MIKAVIFDLDGTLAYTLPDIFNNTNRVRVHYGYPKLTMEEFMVILNGTTKELVTNSLPKGLSQDFYNEAIAYYLQEYDIHFFDETTAYDGMDNVLHELLNSGYIVSVLSNKDDNHTRRIVEGLYGEIFKDVLGPNHFPGKPNPESSLYLCNKYNLKPSEVIYVGDSETDIKTAQNAGMNIICVTWGYRKKEDLDKAGGKNYAYKPSDILDIVKTINK